MLLVTINMELVIDEEDLVPYMGTILNVKEKLAAYLNNKLYTDPEFFGDFGTENITEIKQWE
jgi:hypothetical protein